MLQHNVHVNTLNNKVPNKYAEKLTQTAQCIVYFLLHSSNILCEKSVRPDQTAHICGLIRTCAVLIVPGMFYFDPAYYITKLLLLWDHIYPQYSNTFSSYRNCPKIRTGPFYNMYELICLNIARWFANSVDPDQTPRSAASDQGLHCLLRPLTWGKYCILFRL